MKSLPPTLTMILDDQTFEISNMSPAVQELIEFYDDWRARERDAVSELTLIRSAQQHLQQQLVQAVQAEIAAARAATASPAAGPEPVAQEVQDVIARAAKPSVRNSRKK